MFQTARERSKTQKTHRLYQHTGRKSLHDVRVLDSAGHASQRPHHLSCTCCEQICIPMQSLSTTLTQRRFRINSPSKFLAVYFFLPGKFLAVSIFPQTNFFYIIITLKAHIQAILLLSKIQLIYLASFLFFTFFLLRQVSYLKANSQSFGSLGQIITQIIIRVGKLIASSRPSW